MNSSDVVKLSSELGVDYNASLVVLYDIRGYSVTQIATLDDDEIEELIRWYTSGHCPACFQEINVDHIVCDDCLEQAKSAISRN